MGSDAATFAVGHKRITLAVPIPVARQAYLRVAGWYRIHFITTMAVSINEFGGAALGLSSTSSQGLAAGFPGWCSDLMP